MNPHTEALLKTNAAQPTKSLLDDIVAEHGSRYMPTLTIRQFTERERMLRELKDILVKDIDYGVIPGTEKPTLLKPGAEKICTFFGYSPQYIETCIEDWSGQEHGGEPLFYYKYTCVLAKDGKPVGEGIGSANSWESKYRYRWLRKDQLPSDLDIANLPTRGGKQTLFVYDFALEKGETTGQYGKPAEYWQQFHDAINSGTARKVNKPFKSGKAGVGFEIDIDSEVYRVPNDAFPDIINTCQKMGQKRAYIAATLSATGASQFFTQDVEDLPHFNETPAPTARNEPQDAPEPEKAPKPQAPAPNRPQPAETQAQVRDRRIAEEQAKSTPAPAMTVGGQAVPEELVMVFKGCSTKKGLTQAHDMIYSAMCDSLGDARAGEIWRDVNKKHAVDTNSTLGIHKAAMLEMWNTMLAEAPAKETA